MTLYSSIDFEKHCFLIFIRERVKNNIVNFTSVKFTVKNQKYLQVLEIRHVQARSVQKLNPVQPIQKTYRQMKAIPQLVLRQEQYRPSIKGTVGKEGQ